MPAGLADVDICNMALSQLGLSNLIQSINPPDQSSQAQALAFWFPKCLDEAVQSAPWSFAYFFTNLVQEPVPSTTGPQLGYAAPGWQYSYQFPSDCLQPIAVTTLEGSRYGPQFWTGYWWPSVGMTLSLPKIPYQVMQSIANPGTQCILCDFLASAQSPLYLWYIQQIRSTANFDPMFAQALSQLLGWRAGGVLRAAKDKVDTCMQNWKAARLEALAQCLNAAQQDLARDSPSVQSRW